MTILCDIFLTQVFNFKENTVWHFGEYLIMGTGVNAMSRGTEENYVIMSISQNNYKANHSCSSFRIANCKS
jgi:hypothetical protein